MARLRSAGGHRWCERLRQLVAERHAARRTTMTRWQAKTMKTLRSLVVAVGLGLASLVPTVALADLPDMLARGIINIAVPESFPPFGALGMEGEHQGYDVDAA